MLGVGQNYDMSKYLPAESNAKAGIDILKDEFSDNGNASLLIEDVSIVEAVETAKQVEAIAGVHKVVWLDDVTDLKKPIEMIDEEIVNNYYSGRNALLQVVFEEDDYSQTTNHAIEDIKTLLNGDALLTGSAVDAYTNVNAIGGNILTGILIALAIILIILLLATDSFFDIVLFLITIGVAILLNMGTNVIFGEVSYMTFASASILQLAISMDYSIFLMHRFEHERETEKDPARAMAKASKASFSSIMSSGMTTFVGFIALIFMSYTVGQDMGLVLAKGILFSLLCVMVLLPALAVGSVKILDKMRHKRWLPSMKKAQHVLSGKIKYVVLGLMVVVSAVCFMAQSNNRYLYSERNVGNVDQDEVNEKIENQFGVDNFLVLIVPQGDETAEYAMVTEIEALSDVKSMQGLYAFIDPSVPKEILPETIKDEFLSENYSRYIAEVDLDKESDRAMAAVEDMRGIADKWFDEWYLTGASPVLFDIQQQTAGDFSLVTILSAVFVGIILLLTFRSLTLPIILLFIIETSIWINMSIPYFTGEPMIFIGYMVVSAVQLGATIDYAILMTNYYLEGRKMLGKRAAGEYAADRAGASILVSALVLTTAGFVVSATFDQEAMAQLGILIGRGAVLSGVMAIFVLPQVLILLDKVISKTTLHNKLFIRRKRNEN